MELQQLVTTIQQLSNQIATLKKPESKPHRSDELKDLFAALSKAQAEMETAELSSENPFF